MKAYGHRPTQCVSRLKLRPHQAESAPAQPSCKGKAQDPTTLCSGADVEVELMDETRAIL